jgi:MOSC domain-containing protein YiiM
MSTTATATSTSTSTKTTLLTPRILSVSKSSSHTNAKTPVPSITLIPNHGVDGDCHAGQTTQHRAQPQRTPNLRQVHLVPVETLRELSGRLSAAKPLSAGEIGENITTEGVELATLPLGTEVHFLGEDGKEEAVVVLTGVREPGPGMDKCRAGLKNVCVVRDGSRVVKRLAGVMGTVKKGGMLRPGMGIRIVKPAGGSVRPLPVV